MQTINPTTRWILIVEFIIAVYMLIALTTSQYHSYKVERYIEQFEVQNQELALENEDLRDDFEYFTSPQYQEKIAKQNFGLINPGEEILFIPADDETLNKSFDENLEEQQEEFYRKLSSPKKWWYYFFK